MAIEMNSGKREGTLSEKNHDLLIERPKKEDSAMKLEGLESDNESESSEEELEDKQEDEFVAKPKTVIRQDTEDEEDEEDDSEGDAANDTEGYDEIEEMEKQLVGDNTFGIDKMKKLSPEQLQKQQRKVKRTGVVYLSSIPPYMKPTKIRQIFSRFGEIGRIFLKPEDLKIHRNRVKSGGNKKRKFDEGWCEFISKKDAKLAAFTLNGNILGGKKHSFYHDDIMNVKYLKGFKWADLTSALNEEKEVRESKMEAELSLQHRMDKAFIDNVETSKMVRGMEKKRKHTDSDTTDVRRVFKQRSVATNRSGAKEEEKLRSEKHGNLENVLNKLL
ncbi:hypothetical protein FOA43_002740 [Brettanomyces nanus]|uniref:Pre-rRNA-processing protein ESF2 n=1 Tax=Eeniella nana TaxID=13502 RepID=A0A875S201_EENNA|nr:uncharacterized protein FOA43_002740 [Brettanomyces nanus]QPG75386.1 hypothetical protein FOA43_002740 [Brettanomyces nanus]